MSRDYLELSPTPVGESCEQLGPDYSRTRAMAECRAFLRQLRRLFGDEPEGARLSVSSNPHDFGTYHEVRVSYDEDSREAIDYAFRLEGNLPESWDRQALEELQAAGLNVRDPESELPTPPLPAAPRTAEDALAEESAD